MCIFCKIVNGELPSRKIYEDDDIVAFLDINPAAKGHTLVLPKKHYQDILDTPSDILYKQMKVTKKLTKEILRKLNADGANILNNLNEASGQVIFHNHFHIIPRFDNDEFKIIHPTYDFNLDEIHSILTK